VWSPSYVVASCGGAPLEVITDDVRSQRQPESAYPGPEGPGLRRYRYAIKELFGKTYPALLCEIRLSRALQALQSGDETISRISLQVGFTDASYFTRVFRRMYGVSPQTFRNRRASA
jgi:hypothetical protein